MKFYLIIWTLILTSLPLTGWGQDYLPIRPGRTYFFGNQNKVIRIDSVELAAGVGIEKYFPINKDAICKELENQYLPQFRAYRDSLYLLDLVQATFEVFSEKGKKFTIPYSLETGDSANCYIDLSQNIHLYWTVVSIQEELALEYSDTVKTMVLTALDSVGNQLFSHPANGQIMRLGKKLGALDWPDWDRLLLFQSMYELAGITELQLGKSGLTDHEIFELYPGDKIDFANESSGIAYYSNLYFRISILSRDTIGQKIVIIRKLVRSSTVRQFPDPENKSVYTSFDTISLSITPRMIIPWERDSVGYPESKFPVLLDEEGIPGVKLLSYEILDFPSTPQDSFCWMTDTHAFLKCYQGLGCHIFGYYVRGSTKVGIRYYQKSDSTWGTPLPDSVFSNAVSIDMPSQESRISIAPNPATDALNISFQDRQATIEVLDLSGRLIRRNQIAPGQYDISDLPNGIYLIRIPESHFIQKWVKRG